MPRHHAPANAVLDYQRGYPPTVNWAAETEIAAEVATGVVGTEQVDREVSPMMGSEDFAFMLEEKPGCYVLLGAGPGAYHAART